MPTLIKLEDGAFIDTADSWVVVGAEDTTPDTGDVILPLARFEAEGEAVLAGDRRVGVLLAAGDRVEALAYDLPRISVVALAFPKFRDGRAYSTAALLRERLGYRGEIRAVGEVVRDQARELVRVGINAFAPSDASTAAQWAASAGRMRHVYQRAADALSPAFVERF